VSSKRGEQKRIEEEIYTIVVVPTEAIERKRGPSRGSLTTLRVQGVS